VQVPPENDNIWQFLFEALPPDFRIFEREFYFYNSLCNIFRTTIENQNQNADEILNFLPIPLTLPGELSPSKAIKEPLVFESLTTTGYRIWKEEFIGLDLEHALIAMQTYGIMHAVGLSTKILQDDVLLELLNLDITKTFGALAFEKIDEWITAFISWMMEHKIDKSSILELEHQLKDRNRNMMNEMFREGKLQELQVVSHGDARSSNILFKYDCESKHPIGAKLVDFQSSFLFNPFFDLVYFLMLSVSENVVTRHYMDLLVR
jgi:hypothetical protein